MRETCADHVVGYSRPFAQPRQVQLLHFSLPAHVVHQEVGVAFSPNESHNCLLLAGHERPTARSVWTVHYTVNGTML